MRDPRPGTPALWLWAVAAILWFAAAPGTAAPLSAHEVASALARLGPRPDGGKTQERAVPLLLDSLRRAGLRDVRAVPLAGSKTVVNVQGVLPGTTGREIVLSAHYDSVERSTGAGDDASGCGVAVAAAAELARAGTPLRHTVRVILFDAEETGLHGSRGWVETLPQPARDRILADINVEMVGWAGSTGPTLHAIPIPAKEGEEKGERVTTPGWLVDAALASGVASGLRLHVADPRQSLAMQLLLRGTRVGFGADSGAFLERGVPAVTLSDSSFFAMDPAYHQAMDTVERLDPARLHAWTRLVAGTVRRLDRLEGRPAPENDYLVLAGRVWTRWVLAGLLVVLGILLAVRLRRWAFPALLSAAAVAAPILAFPLLLPAALLAFLPPAGRGLRVLWTLLGLVPLLLYLLLLSGAWAVGLSAWKAGFQESWIGAALVLAALTAWTLLPRLKDDRTGARPAFR